MFLSNGSFVSARSVAQIAAPASSSNPETESANKDSDLNASLPIQEINKSSHGNSSDPKVQQDLPSHQTKFILPKPYYRPPLIPVSPAHMTLFPAAGFPPMYPTMMVNLKSAHSAAPPPNPTPAGSSLSAPNELNLVNRPMNHSSAHVVKKGPKVHSMELWMKMYEKAKEFKRRRGHCYIPNPNYGKRPSQQEGDEDLEKWARVQRMHYDPNNGVDIEEMNDTDRQKQKLLVELGFVFKMHADRWWRMYDKLVGFYRRCGHCRVPATYREDKALGTWIRTQRRHFAEKKFSQERVEALKRINFEFVLRPRRRRRRQSPEAGNIVDSR